MKNLIIPISPRLESYLYALVAEEGFGEDVDEVTLALVWRGVHEQIARGLIEQLQPAWPATGTTGEEAEGG